MVKYLNPQEAKKYSLSTINNTYYLGYRDIPSLIKKHVKGKRSIDYGCGTGRSTTFIKNLGFEVIGVDISKEMIQQALKTDTQNHYLLIDNAKIPVLDSTCDLIFACFVLCTIQTKQELMKVLNEIHRCLTDNGIFIAVTTSDIFYSLEWLSYKTNYPGNDQLKTGAMAKFYLKDLDVELKNYYWTDEDNREMFRLSKLEIVEKLNPLGNINDEMSWISETKHPPYAIYVLKKADS